MIRLRSSGFPSSLMLMGLEDKGKSEGNTLFYWIPGTPVVPPSAWTTGVPRMTWGGVIARLVPGNPVDIASSTYRHFTSPGLPRTIQ